MERHRHFVRHILIKKPASGSRITYIVSPRKVYEVTGHVWRGKEALRKKNKAEEHIEE